MRNILLCAALLSPLFAAAVAHGAESVDDKSLASKAPTYDAAGFVNAPDQEEGWTALPAGRPFPELLSDPRDLKLGIRRNSKNELEADVGAYRSFAGWKGEVSGETTVIHIGLEGQAYFNMRKEGAKFPLNSSDGVIGLYGEGARGDWMYQARFTHLSAHLSDGLFGVRTRYTYTRETLSLRLARQLGFTRAYAGYHFLVHTKPNFPRHSLQLGFYSIFPWSVGIVHPYVGADFKLRNSQEGNNLQLSAGLAMVSRNGMPPIRLAFNYTTGHDLRGQFYQERVNQWSVGLEMDI